MTEGRPNNLVEAIKDLERRLRIAERTAKNFVPGYATDPANPQEGLMWFNTAQNRLKLRWGGTTHYWTRDGTG